MSGLRLVLRSPPTRPLDLSPLLPSRLAGLGEAEIARLKLAHRVVVADVFEVRMGEAAAVTIEGGSPLFDRVGAGLDAGLLRLDGPAGQLAGAGMTGGRLELRGDAGPFAAAGLLGGTVEVGGDVGDDLGAPAPDQRVGMAGGLVVVRGCAGRRAGDRQRRGVLVVEGDAGEYAGSRMIAGSLVVCGRAGGHAGALMRRGTLVLGEAAAPGPTFVRSGEAGLVFTRLLARYLLDTIGGSRAAAALLGRELHRHVGDLACLGLGEMLLGDVRT